MAKKYRLHFHPQANKKLVKYARQVKRELHTWEIIREIARRLDVDHRYVRENLTKGIEPTDSTPEGRATRVKLFMKQYKPKPKKERQPDTRPDWLKRRVKAIRRMVHDTNEAVIRRSHLQ